MDGAPVEHPTFPCEYCGKTFTRLFNLNRHIKTAHQDVQSPSIPHLQKFPCKYCGQTFNRLFSLKRHIKTVHKDVQSPSIPPRQKPTLQKQAALSCEDEGKKLVTQYKNIRFDFTDPETMPDSLLEMFGPEQCAVLQANWRIVRNFEITTKRCSIPGYDEKNIPGFLEMYNIRILGQRIKDIRTALFTII